MAYTHILTPIDLSPHSLQTLRYAFEEAAVHRAKLTLLHVLQHHPDTEEYYIKGSPEIVAGLQSSMFAFPTGFDPDTGGKLPTPPIPSPVVVHRDYLEEVRNQLRDLIPDDFEGDWAAEVVTGHPTDAIVHFAQEQGADLIVMGSHGHTGLRHLLLGSVAEHVMHHAACPVLIVRYLEAKR